MNAQQEDLDSLPDSTSNSQRFDHISPYEVLPYYDYIKKNRHDRKKEDSYLNGIE
jgi:hypothetical protein